MRAGLLILLAAISCKPVDAPTRSQSEDEPAPAVEEPEVKHPPAVENSPAPRHPQGYIETTCLARYELGSNTVLDEQRRRSGAERWFDFPKRYPAATIDPSKHLAVEATAEHRSGDAPILWFTPDFSDAVVDATLLGELTIVDATRLRPGDRQPLGTVTKRGREQLSGRALLDFLLRSDAIQTYVHIGSKLCLFGEFEHAGSYHAELTGEHEFYTNQENHQPFAFALVIESDGRLEIVGARPRPLPGTPVPEPGARHP